MPRQQHDQRAASRRLWKLGQCRHGHGGSAFYIKPQARQLVACTLNLLLGDAEYRAARGPYGGQYLSAPRRLADGDAGGDGRISDQGFDRLPSSAKGLVDGCAGRGLNGEQSWQPIDLAGLL